MSRNPAQLGNHVQLHTLLLGATDADYPEFAAVNHLLDANPARCFQQRGELEASIQWWQVCIHAAEVVRIAQMAAQAAMLLPLSQSTITNLVNQPVTTGPPVASDVLVPIPLTASRYSALKARVTFTDQTALQRVVELDIGGGSTLSFCGSHVSVDILSPNPTMVVPPGATEAELVALGPLEDAAGVALPGIVLDSWLQASAAPAPCAPIGRRVCRYSITRRLRGVAILIKVPAGAVELQIYTNPPEPSANTYTWVTSTSGVLPLNTVGGFSPIQVANGNIMRVPGLARYLLVAPPLPDATITTVWTLEY